MIERIPFYYSVPLKKTPDYVFKTFPRLNDENNGAFYMMNTFLL